MMKRFMIIGVIFSLTLSGLIGAEEYTVMRPDPETLKKWMEAYDNAPRAPILPQVEPPAGKLNLIDHLKYTPAERDQGGCANCWAWAGTGCLEIALHVQMGVKDRLSVQYITSCEQGVIGKTCCAGGWLADFADFYRLERHCIPWTDKNANWQDGDASCDTSCNSIITTPNYPVKYITDQVISTHGLPKETVIANIKNVLAQNKAIWLAFYLPSNTEWTTFYDFWGNNDESVLWNPDFACGRDWKQAEGAGHAVLCVGYNDDNPNNRYWIMLNSWGTAGGKRPNGFFYLSMDINYDCTFKVQGTDMYALLWETLDVVFDFATPTPTPIYDPGDVCAKPLTIPSTGGTYKGSTSTFHNFYDPSTSSLWNKTWIMAGPDCVYKIDIPTPLRITNVTARIITAYFDNALYLIRDCSDPAGSLLVFADEYYDKTGEAISWKPDCAGSVYLVVDSYHPEVKGPYSLEVTMATPPTPTPTVIPTPTPHPSPTSTPSPTPVLLPEEYVYTFDKGAEDWKSNYVQGVFDSPAFSVTGGCIVFSPGGSPNCFGSWESPFHAFTAGQKYRARFRIKTNQPDKTRIPTFRIRIGDRESQVITDLTINSMGGAENAPSLSGTVYEMIYQPPATAMQLGYSIIIDLINIGDQNDPYANIYIDMVEIKKATVTVP
ncbi:MAG: C1 family peptidase [Candidatus Sumerlaeota bacterium]|nr:C1 family peptidase [Candidatus Sumerlaeota bacterium]